MAIGVVIAQNITNSHVCTLRNSVAVASSSCCVYRLVFIIIDGGFHPQPLVSLRNTYLESTIYLFNTAWRLVTKIKPLSHRISALCFATSDASKALSLDV
jgi:hypothetical protein